VRGARCTVDHSLPAETVSSAIGAVSSLPGAASDAGGPVPSVPGLSCALSSFLERCALSTPFLVVDGAVVSQKLSDLRLALPDAEMFYAVKANPLPGVLALVANAGVGCDVAGAAEIRLCLEAGIPSSRLSFGNTIKRPADIAYAHRSGIETFAVDSEEELQKVARFAPGANVFVRLLTDSTGAEWPLSRKFGCDMEMAVALLQAAPRLGLRPHGVSFHVGSQQTDPNQWDAPIAACAVIFRRLQRHGVELRALNLGGGFPARYSRAVPPIAAYAAAIRRSLRTHFGSSVPQLVIEPGRYLVGEAGVIQTEVLLVARKSRRDGHRWVYIDCGKFGGLAETMDEAIRYPVVVPHCHARLAPAVLAGPTCDSADILYERVPVELPEDLRDGDRMQILATGAYTFTYASVGFNGIPPLQTVFLPEARPRVSGASTGALPGD
jgi:ornithine decarboxylase